MLRCRPLPAQRWPAEAVAVGRAARRRPVVHCGHAGEGRLLVEGVAPSNTLLALLPRQVAPGRDRRAGRDLEASCHDDPDAGHVRRAPWPTMRGPAGRACGRTGRRRRRSSARSIRDQDVGVPRRPAPEVEQGARPSRSCSGAGTSRAAETLAIGDNWNDHEMLQRAPACGLVMGNADPRDARLGLPVLPTNDEDGVAVAIETHVLGQVSRPRRCVRGRCRPWPERGRECRERRAVPLIATLRVERQRG